MTDEILNDASVNILVRGKIKYENIVGVASIIFGVAVLLFVLAVFNRPAVFPDTGPYMDNGANVYRAVARSLHLIPSPKPVSASVANIRWLHASQELTMMAARSPWYGIFARPLEWLGTLWLLAAVQSLIAAWLIWLSWRTFAPGAARWTAFAVQGFTAAFSTLPFVAGFAMPDVFASFLILAVTLLLVAWDRLDICERAALALLTAYSATVHGVNALLAAAIVILAAGLALRVLAARKASWAPICIIICALSGGVTAVALSNIAINLIHRQAPGRPPFLAIRLIADGPGRIYLRTACAQGELYVFCQYKDKSLDDSQTMLWGSAAEGVFGPSDPAHRVAMQREEMKIVIGTVTHYPVGVAMSVVKNWIVQMAMLSTEAPLVDQRMYLGYPNLYPKNLPNTREIYLDTWNYKSYRSSVLSKMVKRVDDCTAQPERCRPRLTIGAAKWLQSSEFGIACVALVAIAIQMLERLSPGAGAIDGKWLRALGLIVFAIVTNALLCGAISGPFPRYQSSVAWLVVTMVAIGFCALARKPSSSEA